MDNSNKNLAGLLHESQFPDGIIRPSMLAASPTQAAGDLYYVNSSGIFQKLAIGTSSQVLTVNSGVPAWATPSTYSLPMRHQAITTSTTQTGITLQGGWSYVTGNTTADMQKAITYPVAFSTLLVPPVVGLLGGKNSVGVPTALSDFATDWTVAQNAVAQSPTTTGFTCIVINASTLTANQYTGFSWWAVGIV